MTTQYTPILKLALPVTGELSGTWGDVVNDNITSMVEQAIAGLATISTWTGNSHTLTTANGTTSESRCAMLVAQNGAGLTAAGEIVCPASSKLYVLKNDTSYAITLKTSAGTGVAVASGNTAFLFCDGTNVNACVTTIVDGRVTGNLTVDGNATVNGNTTLGNANTDTITATGRFNTDLLPSTDNARDLGSSGNSWKDVYIDGTAYLALVDINGGTIDGVSIGASTAATIINVDNLRLDGNTLSSTDTNGNVVIAPNGTGDVQLDADTVRVGDSAAAVTLTSNGAGALTVTTGGAANLVLSTNSGTTSGTITINNGANGNIVLAPDGTGDVQLDADTVRIGDANTDVTLTTNGTGNLNLTTNGGTNSGTIQIAQGANGNITLTPNGTGSVSVPKLVWSNGTSGRVPYLTTGGQFTDDADMTFDGTTLTVNSLSVTTGVVFSGGTANGVVYLNGSKQATAGSALTFTNGNALTIDGGTTGYLLGPTGEILIGEDVSGLYIGNGFGVSPAIPILFGHSATTEARYSVASGAYHRWLVGTEKMRLEGNNLLLGTTTQKVTTVTGGATGMTIGAAGAPTIALWDTDNAAYVGYWSQINDAMYFGNNANGPLYLQTNSTTKATITAGGNLLLGTTTDAGRLTINGTARSLGGNFELDTGQVTTNSSSNPLILGVNGVERARLINGGSFLVGQTTEAYQSRSSSIQAQGEFSNGGFGRIQTPGQQIGSATYAGLYGMANLYLAYYNGGWKSLGGGTASAVTIDEGIYSFSNSQNIGAADTALTWTTRFTISSTSTDINNGYVKIGSPATSTDEFWLQPGSTEFALRGRQAKALTLWTSDVERARITSGGDLLVGTTSSSGRLTVVTGAGSQAALFQSGSGTTQQAIATFSNSTNSGYLSIAGVGTSSAVGTWTNGSMVVEGVPFSSGNTFFGSYTGALVFQNGRVNSGRFTSDGNFLIGTDSPLNNERLNVTKSINLFLSRFSNTASSGNAYGIQVVYPNVTPNNADSFFHGCYDGGGTLRFAVYSNGGVANYTANNVNLSDRREKTNFAPAGEYLAKICAIPVQTFNYIDQNMEEDPGLTLGVVAQDVQVVAPELVSESNWGTQEEPKIRLSIYQTDLQYALMKSIQELAAQVETLKAEVAALKGA